MRPQMPSQPTQVERQPTVADCANFLECIAPLAQEYEENLEKRNADIGFNLFELISDHYYRETFHSDILNALLDPEQKHGEKDKFLKLFLHYLNSQHEAKINLTHYSDAKVVKEEGRIDILIKGCKHAIIIENKINGAVDQKKQLPRYLMKIRDSYSCDAIVYLRLNGIAGPSEEGWMDGEFELQLIEELKRKLKVICAYDETNKDLLNGWILKCRDEAKENSDAQHILRQYGEIIRKLGGNIMNKPIMDAFYEMMVEGNKLKIALSLNAMVDDLILYRTEKIRDKFKDDIAPFLKIDICGTNDAYFEGEIWRDANIGLDIGVGPESYLLTFWDKKDPEGTKGHAMEILNQINCFDEYEHECDWHGKFVMRRKFVFPSEEVDLIMHIKDFKKKLAEVVKSMSCSVQ